MKDEGRSLPPLLDAARAASRLDRIEYRDAIAEYDEAALPAMREWLAEAEMAGFAVRVIARIGVEGARGPAVEVLRAARPKASDAVRRDTDAALDGLGVRPATPTGAPGPKHPVQIKDSLYAMLADAARNRRVVTYTDAGELLGISMRNPYHRKLLGLRASSPPTWANARTPAGGTGTATSHAPPTRSRETRNRCRGWGERSLGELAPEASPDGGVPYTCTPWRLMTL